MPPVTVDDPAADYLIQAYSDAWDAIQIRLQRLVDDPLAETKRARLRELQTGISRQMADLDDETDGYIRNSFPAQYEAAMASGFSEVAADTAQFVFNQADRQAAIVVGQEMFRDLAAARLKVEETTRTLIRKVGQDSALRSVLQGDTAKQASREMRRILAEDGIHAVTYANGARHGLKGYAEMVVRSQTAIAYNTAVMNGMERAVGTDVVFVEVFDGPGCGWEYHDSPRQANGLVLHQDEAMAFPISHPNCRRAFGYRPDVTSKEEAAKASGTATARQTEAQIAQDEARGLPTRQEVRARQEAVARGERPNPDRANRIPGFDQAQPRLQKALDRPALAQAKAEAPTPPRAAKAQQRAATAQAKVTGFGPSPANAPIAKQTVEIGGQWYPRYIDAVKQVRPDLKGQIAGTSQLYRIREYKQRFAEFAGVERTEFELLSFARDEAARLGLGKNIQPLVSMMGPEQEQRIVKYLVDGGKMPEPPDLVAGTRAADIPQVRVKWSETRFDPVTDVEGWAAEAEAVQADLTAAQRKAMLDYSHGGDGPVNKRLRADGKDGPKVNALRAAMRPVRRSTRVERGVDADGLGIDLGGLARGAARDDRIIEQLQGMVGRQLEDRGFLSTSVEPGGAFTGDVRMIIDVPQGTRGAWMRPYSAHPTENELLLDRGTRLEVTRVEIAPEEARRGGAKAGRVATVHVRVVAQSDATGLS